MKTIYAYGLVFLFTLTSSALFAQSEKQQRIQASYMLAFGRPADGGEVNYWMSQSEKTVSKHLENHRSYAKANASVKRDIIKRSYNDALGRNPNSAEYDYWMKYDQLYVEMMKNHVQWLASNPSEFDKVIRNSYKFVFKREPVAGEWAHWRKFQGSSYVMLVGCHEQWLKQNPQARQSTAGNTIATNGSTYLNTVPLSNPVANEAKAAGGLNNVSNVIAAGGGNVVAAGGGNVIAAGGGNLIGQAGGN